MNKHRKMKFKEREKENVFFSRIAGSPRENHLACQAQPWLVVFEHRNKSKNGGKRYEIEYL